MFAMTASPPQSSTSEEEPETHMTLLTSPSSGMTNYGSGVSHSAVPVCAAEVPVNEIPSTLHWVRTPYHGFRSVRVYTTLSLSGCPVLTFALPHGDLVASLIAQVWVYRLGHYGVRIKDDWGCVFDVTEADCTCRASGHCWHNDAALDALAVVRHWEHQRERLAVRFERKAAA